MLICLQVMETSTELKLQVLLRRLLSRTDWVILVNTKDKHMTELKMLIYCAEKEQTCEIVTSPNRGEGIRNHGPNGFWKNE